MENTELMNETTKALVEGRYFFEGKNGEDSKSEAFSIYNKALETNPNDIPLLMQLAECYCTGTGVEKDEAKALSLLRECCLLDIADKEYKYAEELDNRSDAECIKWFESSYERGTEKALKNLIIIFRNNKYPGADKQKYVSYLKTAGESGDEVALLSYAIEQLNIPAISAEEKSNAVSTLTGLANKGNPDAMYEMYKIYQNGIGVERDEVAAKIWLEKCADMGNLEAAFNYGLNLVNSVQNINNPADENKLLMGYRYLKKAYESGMGQAEDPLYRLSLKEIDRKVNEKPEALSSEYLEMFRMISQKAENGEPDAQMIMSRCYLEGFQVSKDYDRAYGYALKASEKGNIKAKLTLADIYSDANWWGHNYNEAEKFYNEVASSGEQTEVAYALNKMAFISFSIIDNRTRAFVLWKQSAEMGNEVAAYNLGLLYYYGNGTEQNSDRARYWLQKASDMGYQPASQAISTIFPAVVTADPTYVSLQNGQWVCARCGSIVEAGRGMCSKCGTVKGYY